MKRKTLEEKSIGELKKDLDEVFSKFIRQRDAGICFTCGDKKPWKYQQNGHYVSRSHNSLRYHEKNCHCQCYRCNIPLGGNLTEYALRLERKYGKGILQELDKLKNKTKKFTPHELIRLIHEYKEKIKS